MIENLKRPRATRRAARIPGRRRRQAVGTAVVVLLAGPLTFVGIGQATAEQGQPVPASQLNTQAGDALEAYRQQTVRWQTCTGVGGLGGEDLSKIKGLQCASIKAPLDYRDAAGPAITVAISRLATTEPGKRRGVLLSNPGGPGGPGLDMPGQLRKALPVAVGEQYDLIGMDPRGTGRSTTVRCRLNGKQSWFADSFAYAYDPETFDQVVTKSRDIAATCVRNIGPRMAHFTTANTARDMDLIRGVLGERKISYFGVSYGTYLGAVYTQLFGNRADRIVLDSSMGPSGAGTYHLLAADSPRAFGRWAAWTARHEKYYHLGRTPAQVTRTFFGLVRSLEQQPREGLDPGDVRWQMRRAMYDLKEGAEYVVALQDNVRTAPPMTGPTPEPDPDNPNAADDAFRSLSAVNQCGDGWKWSSDVEKYRRDAIRAKKLYPLGGDHAYNINPCAFWAYPSPEPPVTINNRTGALIVNNEWDSQTPLAGARQMHQALRNSRLITVENGQGHALLYDQAVNPCALDHISTYLSSGHLPATDKTCHTPAPTPGPSGDQAPSDQK